MLIAHTSFEKLRFFRIRILRVASADGNRDPVYLAAALPIGTVEEIRRLVRLYSSRRTVETFSFNFKQASGRSEPRS